MDTRRKWRLGVIGCGAWGPNHVRNFSALPNVEVVGVADLQDRLARVKAHRAGDRDFPTRPQMMAHASPMPSSSRRRPKTHYEVVREALLAGKHVLCEKPLCVDRADADALVRLAEEKKWS